MYNYIVIGGGIVGLATAYALRKAEKEASILILEKENEPAFHQTGRNSGVIHSGVYYKPGSLKAKLATTGRLKLVEFCREHNIPFENCGKVIVATEKSELEYLDILEERGRKNGLNVKQLDKNELTEKEPYVNGLAALFVPEAGIVNYKKVSRVLTEVLKESGVEIQLGKKVTNITPGSETCGLESSEGDRFEAEHFINCGGLHSDILASKSGVSIKHRIVPFRGEYYELIPERRYLVKNLIYPVPNPSFPFLGVHFTRMIDGSIHAGPNAVLSLKREGYSKLSFNLKDMWSTFSYPGFWKLAEKNWKEGFEELYRSLSKKQFVKSLQKLVPDVKEEDLVSSPSGVRAQALNPDGTLVDDFLIKNQGQGIHVCNAPSPAATSSFEIGNTISDYVHKLKNNKEVVL